MPRLTEQEQEIIRFIEADKPLPDKYRFLPFEDKREVELGWNGKTNEVCNIVVPFQTIEQVDESRAEKPSDDNMQLGLFDTRGRLKNPNILEEIAYSLELTSVAHECEPGPRKLAVKIIDIFGNDTMTNVEVSV